MVLDAAAFVFLPPEVALVFDDPPRVADAEPEAEADEPVADADADLGSLVLEALGVAVADLPVVAAAGPRKFVSLPRNRGMDQTLPDDVSCRFITRPPMSSSVGGHGHADVNVAKCRKASRSPTTPNFRSIIRGRVVMSGRFV